MPWTKDDLVRLVELEAHLQGVDPRLARAVAEQESGFDPQARSPKGAYGVMQLMPDTAKQLGVNRDDPADNIRGGVMYLKQQHAAFGGDVSKTLAAYNAGPGAVQAHKGVPPYKETQGYVSRILSKLGPASAEAAGLSAADQSRLQELEAHLARLEGRTAPQPAEAPPPPQAPPEPSPDPTATPGMRFQALPSITRLEPADRLQKTRDFKRLKPAMQEEFLRSEGAPAATPAAPAPMSGPLGTIQPLRPYGAETVHDRRHEAGTPLSAVPAIAVNTLGTVGGAALGAPLGPVGSAAGAALGGSLATRANTALGFAPQEKPLLETPVANVYPSDLLGALPLGIAGGAAALKGTVRNLPGANVAKHELAAERLEKLGERTAPARPAGDLFAEAAQRGGAVPTSSLWKTAGAVVREEMQMESGFRNTEAIQAGRGLLTMMSKHGGTVPLGDLESYRQRLGQKIGTTTDKAELRRLKQLYAALHEDLEHASQTGTAAGAGTLREAIAASRKEHAQAELTDLWSPGKGLQIAGDHTQVYGKRIQNQFEKRLESDKVFAGSFSADELKDIRSTLREVGKLTRMTNPEAQGAVGSTLKWLGRLGGAGGAGYGVATGDLSTMLTGGSILLATEGATAILAKTMQSPVGRWALREAIREGNGALTHGSLSAIAALVAREAAPDAPVQGQAP